ncbi:hypothetical protein TSUD_284680 [Trifolium subterraneum]|uniref:Reverse transcriptase zinc-binding domain-containing protein n=1 Tax=Trifolium subterraneum TaxID=3900 RepID=A0A2Z6PH25_TRISU|nr:hypothetical protein TSUD_284680 [Trifolium subterraneum]
MLSRGISKAVLDGDLTPMSLCRNVQVPTHVLYADDIMVFCKGSKRNLRCLMEIFKSYGEVSGQLINKQKSTIPLNYLGCPIFVGKPKSTHFSAIADKFRVKLASWKGALLSIMGRVQLVRAIIHGNEQWAVMCRARFLKWGQPSNTFLKSSIWHGIKHHIATVKANSRWLIGTASIVHRNAAVHARIFKIVVPRYALPDKLVWCPSKDGILSAKLAYDFLFPSQQQQLWKGWVWHKFVPPSTSFIAGRCFQNKMPTDENLIKRGCIVVLVCDLFLSNLETTSHFFLSCDFAAHLWTWLGARLQIVFNTNSFLTLFESLATGWSQMLKQVAIVAVLHVLKVIWLARNGIRFNNGKIYVHAAKIKALAAIQLSAQLIVGSPKADEQPILQLLAATTSTAVTPSTMTKIVMWCTPSIGWMTVNTDGSVNSNSAACGESDSMNALHAFEDMNVVPWDLRNRWSNCMHLGLTLKWSHIFREGNACADKLASLGHACPQLRWWSPLPPTLRDDFLQDKLGFPQYRTT